MVEKHGAPASDAEAGSDQLSQPASDTSPSRKALTPGPHYHAVATGPDGAETLHAFVASGDDEAIAQALALAEGQMIEIWDGPRWIERLAAATQ